MKDWDQALQIEWVKLNVDEVSNSTLCRMIVLLDKMPQFL